MSIAIIFDAETHAKENPEIIEAAHCFVEFGNPTRIQTIEGTDQDGHPESHAMTYVSRWCPSKPIELGAMAAHHITDEDVAGEEPSSFFEPPACDFWIGHNPDFDHGAAGGTHPAKRIDTCALARDVWPNLDCYSQGALIYHLDRKNAKKLLQGAHSAAADILLCKRILDAEIAATGATDWEQLWNRSEQAKIPRVMQFGKHKGVAIEDLPADYKHWLLTKAENCDEYLRRALTGDTQRTLFCPK